MHKLELTMGRESFCNVDLLINNLFTKAVLAENSFPHLQLFSQLFQ